MFVKKSLYFDEPVVVRKKNKAAFKNRSEEAKKEGNKNATQSIHSRARNSRAFFSKNHTQFHSHKKSTHKARLSLFFFVFRRRRRKDHAKPYHKLSRLFSDQWTRKKRGEGGGAQKTILVAKETEFHQTKVRDIFF